MVMANRLPAVTRFGNGALPRTPLQDLPEKEMPRRVGAGAVVAARAVSPSLKMVLGESPVIGNRPKALGRAPEPRRDTQPAR